MGELTERQKNILLSLMDEFENIHDEIYVTTYSKKKKQVDEYHLCWDYHKNKVKILHKTIIDRDD